MLALKGSLQEAFPPSVQVLPSQHPTATSPTAVDLADADLAPHPFPQVGA